jgi:hypothetical protein
MVCPFCPVMFLDKFVRLYSIIYSIGCHIVEWIKVAQNRDQKRDLGTEKKSNSFSMLVQTILNPNHEFLSRVFEEIDIGCSYLKEK